MKKLFVIVLLAASLQTYGMDRKAAVEKEVTPLSIGSSYESKANIENFEPQALCGIDGEHGRLFREPIASIITDYAPFSFKQISPTLGAQALKVFEIGNLPKILNIYYAESGDFIVTRHVETRTYFLNVWHAKTGNLIFSIKREYENYDEYQAVLPYLFGALNKAGYRPYRHISRDGTGMPVSRDYTTHTLLAAGGSSEEYCDNWRSRDRSKKATLPKTNAHFIRPKTAYNRIIIRDAATDKEITKTGKHKHAVRDADFNVAGDKLITACNQSIFWTCTDNKKGQRRLRNWPRCILNE